MGTRVLRHSPSLSRRRLWTMSTFSIYQWDLGTSCANLPKLGYIKATIGNCWADENGDWYKISTNTCPSGAPWGTTCIDLKTYSASGCATETGTLLTNYQVPTSNDGSNVCETMGVGSGMLKVYSNPAYMPSGNLYDIGAGLTTAQAVYKSVNIYQWLKSTSNGACPGTASVGYTNIPVDVCFMGDDSKYYKWTRSATSDGTGAFYTYGSSSSCSNTNSQTVLTGYSLSSNPCTSGVIGDYDNVVQSSFGSATTSPIHKATTCWNCNQDGFSPNTCISAACSTIGMAASSSSSSDSKGLAIGLGVGGAILFLIILAVVVYFCCCRRKQAGDDAAPTQSATAAPKDESITMGAKV